MKLIDREWRSVAPSLSHVAPFDGIRAVGVLGVLLGHALPDSTLSFAVIVDVFFVISGFLITTLLLQEHRATGGLALRRFYARRTLRLLPALWVLLAFSLVIGVLLRVTHHLEPTYTMRGLLQESSSGFFYVYNLAYPVFNGAWLAHLWTLSLEEQFYLVVGLVMVLAVRRGGVRLVGAGLLAIIAIIQVSRFGGWNGPFGDLPFVVWLQRPDSLMIGVVAAIASAHVPGELGPRARRVLGVVGWFAVAGLVYAVWASTAFVHVHLPALAWDAVPDEPAQFLADPHRYWLSWGFSLGSWSAAVIALCAFRHAQWWPNRILSWHPLAWVGGRLSYPLYLMHLPVYIALSGLFELGRANPVVVLPTPVLIALKFVCTFAVAYPVYRFVELRALNLKSRYAWTNPGTARTGGAAVAGPTAHVDNPPVDPFDLDGVGWLTQRRDLARFFAVTAAVTWSIGTLVVADVVPSWVRLLAAAGPLCGAVVVLSGRGHDAQRAAWRRSWSPRSLTPEAVAWGLAPVAVVGFAIAVSALMGDSSVSVSFNWKSAAILLIPLEQFAYAVLEEAGWRGVALPRLQSKWGPMRATLMLFAAWTLWFLPDLVAARNPGGSVLFAINLLVGAIWLTTIVNRTGSVAAAVLFHFTYNVLTMVKGGPTTAVVTTVFLIGAVVLVVRTRGRLGAPAASPATVVAMPEPVAPLGSPRDDARIRHALGRQL